jgi:Asp-tRNA(Asn)/Glu-tRNA(Gln) amidotransferase A subunit family amidase
MARSPFASASQHATSIRANGQSCQELAELYLSRIHQHNPALHAIVLSNEAGAVQAARERDEDLRHNIVRGPLHGVPVTVKEAFNLEGLKTTVNFPRLKNNVATSDAFVVRRLKEAGAIVLGKTNIPTMLSDYQSFGPLYPTATNPYDRTRTPGGARVAVPPPSPPGSPPWRLAVTSEVRFASRRTFVVCLGSSRPKTPRSMATDMSRRRRPPAAGLWRWPA